MILLDLFSGIGGFHEGFHRAGYKFSKVYFSEIDKHAIACYKYNFKDAEYVGSVTTLESGTIERPNIITFGSPCQDFSLAGKRTGMAGQRSSLIGQAIRLITELRPDVFIWENVKGAFSTNAGADFLAIIQAFTNIGGYRLEWQLVNTSWLLPQNRERIYLIGHLGYGGGSQVFPIRENDKDINKTRQQPGNRLLVNAIDSNYHKGPDGKRTMIRWQNKKSGAVESDIVPTLKSSSGTDIRKMPNVLLSEPTYKASLTQGNIRRLTEIECERLQGFPDNWTKYGDYDGVVKEISMTQRYKLVGNAVTVDMVELIAGRLNLVVN